MTTGDPVLPNLEILPHPKRGTMELGTERILPVFGQIRAAEGSSDDNPVVTIIGTDGSEDRHGSSINPRGWRTASYLRNPVVLWSHGAVEEYPPLGQTIALRAAGGAWEFDIKFALGPWRNMRDNLAQFLWEWYRDFGGALAASVGFMPLKWIDREATQMPTFFAENVEYVDQELTEISFVNVPSNRNALSKAIERARSAGTFTDGMARMLGYRTSPIVMEAPKEEPPSNKRDVASPAVRLAALRSTLKAAREALRDYWADMCGVVLIEACPLCSTPVAIGCDCNDVLEPAAAAAEADSISQGLDAAAQQLSVALDGWNSAEHDTLRSFFSMAVWDSMYRVDRLLDFQDFWYAEQPPSDGLPTMEGDQMRAFTAAVLSDEALGASLKRAAAKRVGAEFSSKNKDAIRSMHEHAQAIATQCRAWVDNLSDDLAAEKTNDDGSFRVLPGSAATGKAAAGQSFLVVATEAPAAGAGDRSNKADQPNFYDDTVLPIRR